MTTNNASTARATKEADSPARAQKYNLMYVNDPKIPKDHPANATNQVDYSTNWFIVMLWFVATNPQAKASFLVGRVQFYTVKL